MLTRMTLQRNALDPAVVALTIALGFCIASRLDGPRLLRRSPRQWWGPSRKSFNPRAALGQRLR